MPRMKESTTKCFSNRAPVTVYRLHCYVKSPKLRAPFVSRLRVQTRPVSTRAAPPGRRFRSLTPPPPPPPLRQMREEQRLLIVRLQLQWAIGEGRQPRSTGLGSKSWGCMRSRSRVCDDRVTACMAPRSERGHLREVRPTVWACQKRGVNRRPRRRRPVACARLRCVCAAAAATSPRPSTAPCCTGHWTGASNARQKQPRGMFECKANLCTACRAQIAFAVLSGSKNCDPNTLLTR
jgi:hypothetical protein